MSKIKIILAPGVVQLQGEVDKWLDSVGPVTVTSTSITVAKGGQATMAVAYDEKAGVKGASYTSGASRKETNPVHGSPYCPQCDSEMVVRYRKIDGEPFWGCSTFPECRMIVAYDREAEEDPTVPIPDRAPRLPFTRPNPNVDGDDSTPFDDGDDIPF